MYEKTESCMRNEQGRRGAGNLIVGVGYAMVFSLGVILCGAAAGISSHT